MDRHRRVSDLFLRACELDPEEREAFLARECADDAELRAEVGFLLAHDERATEACTTALRKPVRAVAGETVLESSSG